MKPSRFPVEAEVVETYKSGQHVKKNAFYGRFGNDMQKIPDPGGRERYMVQVWGP